MAWCFSNAFLSAADKDFPAEYRKAKAKQQKRPEAMEDGDARPEDRAFWQTQKTKLECERIQHWLDIDRGKFVSIEGVANDMLKIGGAVKAAMLRLEADLPPMLVGLDEAAMQIKIRAQGDEILRLFAEMSEELYKPPTEPEAPTS